MSTTTTSAQILHQTTTFISETLSQPHLRRHLSSTFLHTLPPPLVKPLNFAVQTIENAISITSSSLKSSSLRLAEKLLLSTSNNPFSSFLLSLIYHLHQRPIDASLCLLDVFHSDPTLARLEIAPILFEELFLSHFSPILEWYNQRKSNILSSNLSLDYGYNSDDQSIVSNTTFLSKMSGVQASSFRDLERDYEALLDENCRAFVEYFKDVLRNGDENEVIVPPTIVLNKSGTGDKVVYSSEEKTKSQEFGSTNRRYNVIMPYFLECFLFTFLFDSKHFNVSF